MALLAISFSIWFFRLVNEGLTFSNSSAENLWLSVVRPLVLALSGVVLASLYLKKFEQSSRRDFWKWSFWAAAIFCIPYVPDMFASFKKAGENQTLLLSAAFYALGIATYGLIRGGTCAILYRRVLKKVRAAVVRPIVLYLFFLIFEFLFFHTWHPITYFPALPLPIPSARFDSSSVHKNVRYILFETMMDSEQRTQIASGGVIALSILGSKLSQAVAKQIDKESLDKTVFVILPETFVSLSELDDVQLLFEPVARVLFEKFGVDRAVWIQGAFLAGNNLVLGSELGRAELKLLQEGKKAPRVDVIRRKREQMPMFEAPSKGVSYSKVQSKSELFERPIFEEHTELKKFVSNHRILICYESLFPSNWRFGIPSLVLTNHHLFNQFHLMNWVYVGLLRQLSFFFNSSTKIVSNYNPSGVLDSAFTTNDAPDGQPVGFEVVRFQ